VDPVLAGTHPDLEATSSSAAALEQTIVATGYRIVSKIRLTRCSQEATYGTRLSDSPLISTGFGRVSAELRDVSQSREVPGNENWTCCRVIWQAARRWPAVWRLDRLGGNQGPPEVRSQIHSAV
jgi:hypothetical protein